MLLTEAELAAMREELAAIEHQRWADWQAWVHGKGEWRNDGLLLPAHLIERWERQIATPYADLSETEKQSDREQVDRYWPLIERLTAALAAERAVGDQLAAALLGWTGQWPEQTDTADMAALARYRAARQEGR